MIIDRLSNAPLYNGMGERIVSGLRWLQQNDVTALETGRHGIRGELIYAMVQRYRPRPVEGAQWEAHRRYIDVQYVAAGCEHFGYAPLDALRPAGDYDEAKDAVMLDGPGTLLTVDAGTFLVLGPHDAHMPGLAPGEAEPEEVVKAVLKVAVD